LSYLETSSLGSKKFGQATIVAFPGRDWTTRGECKHMGTLYSKAKKFLHKYE
jgi:hypothetical protein